MVTPGYLSAMQIPLIRGRWFTDADTERSPLVAVVDTDFAQRFWPGQDPIGQRISLGAEPDGSPTWRTIVGIVGHIRHYGLEEEGREQTYYPAAQIPRNAMFLTIRTSADPETMIESVRKLVTSVDPALPLYQVNTMSQWLDRSTASRKLNVTLLGIFAGIAVMMALIGIYGVISYAVVMRTHEIGIRLALGAQRSDVAKMILLQGLRILGMGLVIGIAGAALATRALSTLLFGIRATDPVTFVAIPVLLAGVALMASYLPARKATRVDPMIALRYE
jgi:putative ABC transport system permease protein